MCRVIFQGRSTPNCRSLLHFPLIYHSILFFLSKSCYWHSVAELGNLSTDTVEAAAERHIHELGLSVHLKAAKNRLVDLVVDGELLARVLRVGLQGCNDRSCCISVHRHGSSNSPWVLSPWISTSSGYHVAMHDCFDLKKGPPAEYNLLQTSLHSLITL